MAQDQGGMLRVGLVGTGFVARLRVEALTQDERVGEVLVAGRSPEKGEAFAQKWGVRSVSQWQALIEDAEVDIVFVASTNTHRPIVVRAALEAGKAVATEYPLALDLAVAVELTELAASKNLLLHVEHIERLGGVHQALIRHLPEVGQPIYGRYCTIAAKRPAPKKWTFSRSQFGFPLVGALSRIHRVTHAFGTVESVSAREMYWDTTIDGESVNQAGEDFYAACWVGAQIEFTAGMVVGVVYGKGDRFAQGERRFEVRGTEGTLIFDGSEGVLLRGDEAIALDVAGKRGSFKRDTAAVLGAFLENSPLYISMQESLYALQVA
ncbi:MAG: Gfo/Idh/MocA family oxidoreductase, partial [Cyanobacteria bacterium P01_D01_bin.73]